MRVIDLDDVDERAKVGLPERHRPTCQLLAHRAPKALDHRWIDADVRNPLRHRRIKRRLGAVAVSLEAVEPILQDLVEVRWRPASASNRR